MDEGFIKGKITVPWLKAGRISKIGKVLSLYMPDALLMVCKCFPMVHKPLVTQTIRYHMQANDEVGYQLLSNWFPLQDATTLGSSLRLSLWLYKVGVGNY